MLLKARTEVIRYSCMILKLTDGMQRFPKKREKFQKSTAQLSGQLNHQIVFHLIETTVTYSVTF